MREFKALNTSKRQEKTRNSVLCSVPSSVSLSCHIEHKVLESDNMQSTLLQLVFQTLYWEASVQGVLKDCHSLEQRITTSFLFLLCSLNGVARRIMIHKTSNWCSWETQWQYKRDVDMLQLYKALMALSVQPKKRNKPKVTLKHWWMATSFSMSIYSVKPERVSSI